MMECNKEEAIRAKGIAEQKMQIKDFVGARKIALKAQQLFPDLDNISQMLTVCNVHCSAEQKILGSEIDWYAILQIEQTADEALIRKQYRKLALLLHPDKNKFAGAEAAFKLIGEAQRLLSDQNKRTTFDMRRRASMRTAGPKQPAQQVNRNSYVRTSAGVQKNFVNSANPQSTGLNSQQQPQSGYSNGRQTFWTICSFCTMRYQYYREVINRTLRCQNCSQAFMAHELDAQGSQPGASCTRPVFPLQKEALNHVAHKLGPQKGTFGNLQTSSMGFQGNVTGGTTSAEPTGSTPEIGVSFKEKGKGHEYFHMGVGKDRGESPKFEEKSEGQKHSGNMSRKRGRKSDVESSDSCDTGSSSEDNVVMEDGHIPSGKSSEGYYCRRSTRQKQNISYNENLSDDDFPSPSKRSRVSGLSGGLKEESKKDEEVNQENTLHDEGLPNGADKTEECKAARRETLAGDGGKETSKSNGEADSDSSEEPTPDPEYFDCPDPDFSDFDKERDEGRFAADQIWAVYDTVDGMPRFYALVRKVFFPGFKLRITWLEPNPDDVDEIDWLDKDLPIACGNFKRGNSEETVDRLMFSHLICWASGRVRGSCKIYPRKGETWAIFKNWDIKWKSDPDNHRKYEYEFVEILSGYTEEVGFFVGYLGKIEGFVSLFRRMKKRGVESFQIPPGELFRFSHRIPSFRMTGTEREDVPEGSYELDPASLPPKIEDFAHTNDVKMEVECMGINMNMSCSNSLEEKVKPMRGSMSNRSDMAMKGGDHDKKDVFEKGELKNENGSYIGLNGTHKMFGQPNAGQCAGKEQACKNLDDSKHKSHDEFTQATGSTSTCHFDEERHMDTKETNCKNHAENARPPPCSSPEAHEIPEPEFYNFDADKSPEKVQPGQIWALYSDEDGLPRYYCRIKKIESSPDFNLHITWLVACAAPRDMIQWRDKRMPIGCGIFKLRKGKPKVYSGVSSFSHQLRIEPTGEKNKYNIYPKKGEVWAVFRNWNVEWKHSDIENLEYDIVEVIMDDNLQMKVMVLERVNGFNSVFKAQRKRNAAVVMDIPRAELLRFSHQIPAFRLTEEKNGSLRDCWELDPAALPVLLLCAD